MRENTELEMELLNIVRDDYATLETITRSRWPDNIPVPSDEEVVRVLRDLHAKDLVQSYRYTPQEYVPIDEFDDEMAEEVWWMITDAGLAALGGRDEEYEEREERRER